MIAKLQNSSIVKEIRQRIFQTEVINNNENKTLPKRKYFSKKDRMDIVVEGQSDAITIGEICLREGITPAIFYQWTQDFLNTKSHSNDLVIPKSRKVSEDEKFKIVIEGKSGVTSIAEICRREDISQDIFLKWSDDFLKIRNKRYKRESEKDQRTKKQKEKIIKNAGKEALIYFESYIDVTSHSTLIFTNQDLCINEGVEKIQNIVCLQKINDIRRINKHFELINRSLPNGGVLIGCMESFSARRERMKINKYPVINEIFFGCEFVFKRVLPKLSSSTKKIFFDMTKGKDRLMSKAEGLGRVVSSGFKIMDYKTINGLIYFAVKKVDHPKNDVNPSYGPVYQMPRIGENGKIIKVYKFRTMHPYSEFLQEYIVKAHGYAETGKPANDFRIPRWGKIMRRLWLDELPQLINVVRGEMKLVGVRPLSKVRFKEIPTEMQRLRLPHKPGCIPPYISLNRDSDVISLLQAEKDYIEEKMKHPKTTDTKFFFKAIINILFRHKRSA